MGGVPIIFGDDVSGGIGVKASKRPGRHKRSYETKRTINPVQISFSGALDDGRAHYSLGRVKAAGRWRATRAADAEADWQAVLSALVREAEECGADALVEVNFEVEEVAGGIDGVPLSRLVAAGAAVRFAAAA